MRTLVACGLVLVLAVSVSGQRIETQRADRHTVRRVQTTMNHLTVIELAEPVIMAAAGSPAFKIERQGNKVLIQPVEEGATTNLFIWTASGRFSYELAPAPSIETTDFAIDQEPYPAATPQVRVQGSDSSLKENTGIKITDVFEKDGQVFVHYEAETSAAPEVFELQSLQSETPLRNLRYRQVDSATAASLRAKNQRRLSIKEYKSFKNGESGQRVAGFVALSYKSKDSEPTVLRLVFQSEESKATSVFVVL